MELINELNKRHLNIPKILELPDHSQKTVLSLFDKLTKCFSGNNGLHNPALNSRIDHVNGKLLFDSLVEHGYLITRREKRLDDILD
jgi:hypothetical protein